MAKKTKTWKIGEYAVGGVISVEIVGKHLTIINKEWDFNTGSGRRSNQSKAKELSRSIILLNEEGWHITAFDYLSEVTTSYYTNKILDWIEKQYTLSLTA